MLDDFVFLDPSANVASSVTSVGNYIGLGVIFGNLCHRKIYRKLKSTCVTMSYLSIARAIFPMHSANSLTRIQPLNIRISKLNKNWLSLSVGPLDNVYQECVRRASTTKSEWPSSSTSKNAARCRRLISQTTSRLSLPPAGIPSSFGLHSPT